MGWRLIACTLAVLLAFVPGTVPAGTVAAAGAISFPHRPIRLIVPAAAGTNVDRVARTLGAAMADDLGVPVHVINRPGGDGAIGHAAVAVARPDGYTLGIVTEGLVYLHAIRWSPVGPRQVRGIARLGTAPAALVVRSDGPWRSWDDVAAAAQERPGSLRFAAATAEGVPGESVQELWVALGLPQGAFTAAEPGPTAGPWDLLLSGDVDLCLCSSLEAAARSRKGEVYVLAVLAADRVPAYPDVPALVVEGVGERLAGWIGVVGPAYVPDDVIQLLEEAVRRAFDSASVQEELRSAGLLPRFEGAADFQRYLATAAPEGGEGNAPGKR